MSMGTWIGWWAAGLFVAAALRGEAQNIYVSQPRIVTQANSAGVDLSSDMREGDRCAIRIDFGWSSNTRSFQYFILYNGQTVRNSRITVIGNFGFGSAYSPVILATQGVHNLEARVDAYAEVAETDEADNSATRVVTAAAGLTNRWTDLVFSGQVASATFTNLLIGRTNQIQMAVDSPTNWVSLTNLMTYVRATNVSFNLPAGNAVLLRNLQ